MSMKDTTHENRVTGFGLAFFGLFIIGVTLLTGTASNTVIYLGALLLAPGLVIMWKPESTIANVISDFVKRVGRNAERRGRNYSSGNKNTKIIIKDSSITGGIGSITHNEKSE
jgi:hypothetical protein